MTPEVEARFAAIESILAATAQQQALNTQAIAENARAIAATNATLHDEVTNMAHALSALAITFDESSRRVELLNSSVERLINTLTERFGSNGHQE